MITINQHSIPVFYQKYWSVNDEPMVYLLDKKYGINNKPKAIKSCCSEKYLYEGNID